MPNPNTNKFWFSRLIVLVGGDYAIPVNSFAFVATNIAPVGGAIGFINGYPINPPLVAGANGESFSVGGPFGAVLNEAQLEIIFSAGASRVYLTFLYYTNLC